MKKVWVYVLAVVMVISFALTGVAQENATSGPAKPGKQLTKGKFVKTKKPKQSQQTQQTGGTSTAQQSTQAATPAKHKVSSSSTAPTQVQNGVVGPGSASGKKLTKGKFTKQ